MFRGIAISTICLCCMCGLWNFRAVARANCLHDCSVDLVLARVGCNDQYECLETKKKSKTKHAHVHTLMDMYIKTDIYIYVCVYVYVCL